MRTRLAEVAALFLRLGFTAFGGPAAHLSMIEDEVVRRRKWIDRQHFLDMVAAVNFIPGPNSTELVMHLGHVRAGWRGLVVAGVCFIVPAMLIILPLGWLYIRFGQLPGALGPHGPLNGIRACVIAIIAAAMWRFARTGVTDAFTASIAILATAVGFLTQLPRFRIPQAELIILAAAALAGAIRTGRKQPAPVAPAEPSRTPLLPLIATTTLTATTAGTALFWANLLKLSLFLLKVGATLFGSGYVLVSYLRGGLVDDHRWLTAQQLTDAVAVGQVTPGPLLTTATFIGYILGYHWGGLRGAVIGGVIATISIFLPSFFFVSLLGRVWDRLRQSPWARGALNGMNAAVVALILVVAVGLAVQTIHSAWAGAIAVISLAVLLVWNLNATWLVLASGLAGVLLWYAGAQW